MQRKHHWAARLGLVILGLALAGFFASRGTAQKRVIAQPVPPPQPMLGTGTAANLSSVKIQEDARFRQVLNVGRDCIKDQEWKQAVEALQAILMEKSDYYVQVHEQDAVDLKKDNARWTSVKFEANNLIGSMPLDGLNMYELSYGADAKVMLDEAKKTGDRDLVAEVAQKYCHTKAGIEANEIRATLDLARGQVFPAALHFEKLLRMNPERTKLSDLTLFKATLAFRRAGDMKNYEETWKRLQASLAAKQGLKIGDDMVPMARVEGVLNETPVIDIINQHDWPMERGNPPRTAQAVGSPPLLDAPLWKRPLFKDKLDGLPEEDNDQAALDRVTKAIDQARAANLPVLPGGFPIASQGIMVVRSPRDIRAIALKPIDIKAEDGEMIKVKPGEILWKSIPFDRSLAYLLEKPATRNRIDPWLDSYHKLPGFDSFLYDNTTLGSLTTDHRLVYAINDLGVPPHPNLFQFNQFNPNPGLMNIQDVKQLLIGNELCAYDLKNGKMVWDLKGSVTPNSDPKATDSPDPLFDHSHFLSLPISIGGKLYVLNEKLLETGQPAMDPFGRMMNPIPGESEIRLVCIDPNKIVNQKPEIVGKPQSLGVVLRHNRYVQDIPRRVNAVHLAYGEGVLVCPTNAGEVFGIDLMTKSLIWSYPYRETAHQMIGPPISTINPNIRFGPGPATPQSTTVIVSKWHSAPPAIQDGKIVFTAPDADSIHCVNLRDGKPLWKRGKQKDDLFMAGVYQGRVLLVSDNRIRALDLKDGSRVWEIPTNDLPSGQGVASKGIYYLPLKKGEILAVDIAKGEVKAHNRSATPGVSPGNLIFYEGMVLSQTPTEVMAYPQLTARLDAARLDSANEPENLARLTEYGDLLLKDGQVHLAVATLLKVHDRKPANPLGKRVSARLFEALTDLMQLDFPKASGAYLTIYENLTRVPGDEQEQQNRKAKFFRLVGQGREAQGDLVTAFQMYKDFGALPLHADGRITSPNDPNLKVPIDVWLRGRIAGMFAKATPAQRAPLEAKIAAEWKAVQAKNDFNATRSFVGMFDVPFTVGREARVRLAETIMERNDRGSFLEAELYLYQVLGSEFRTEAQTGGRALAALAQLEEKKGTVDSMRLAAAYYRQLGREFADAPVRGNRTGADLINELATDKRFLPFLEENKSPWGPVKMAARDLGPGAFPIHSPVFVMQPQGDATPFARQNRLVLYIPANSSEPHVKLRDSTTGEDRWETSLGHVAMNNQIFIQMYQNHLHAYYPDARYRSYHVKGHLVVCQVGVMVYCLDGDTGKKLWEMQTVQPMLPQNGFFQPPQAAFNQQDGNVGLLFFNQNTQQQVPVPMGRIGSVQASHVAVLGHKGLTVVDPLRGHTLWQKSESDIPVNSHVFGDDQYLFLVEVNDNGSYGAGRTLRASDGEPQLVPDFSNIYQAKIRLLGRHILAAQADAKSLTVRLYDIVAGKDVWSKAFKPGSIVIHTEDKDITGVIEPDGKFTILDAQTGAELISNSIVQTRVGVQDLAGLNDVLLLQDAERYYIALNRPLDRAKVLNGALYNSFSNGIRCRSVNGWVLAYRKNAGQAKIGARDITWKKGDFHWHTHTPIANQLIVLEQFEKMPILLFTSRVVNPSNAWSWQAQSIQKSNGQWVFDSGLRGSNNAPTFMALQIDLKSRTINLIGLSGSVQHYVDEGKGPPPIPAGALNNLPAGQGNAAFVQFPQPVLPPNAFMPLPVLRRVAQIEELPIRIAEPERLKK